MADHLTTTDDRLERADRLDQLSLLTGGLAHDLNNLLAVLRSQLELASMEPFDHAEWRARMARLGITVDHIATVASMLADVSHARDRTDAPADVARTVHDLLVVLDHRCKSLGNVEVDVPADLAHVRLHGGQLMQVVMNLVLNAADAAGCGGTIRIAATDRCDGDAHWVDIVVRDDGPGIPDAIRDRVLEPFVTTKPNGTGLGLSVVHRIATSTGGQVDIDSTPERGTTVRVRLPAA